MKWRDGRWVDTDLLWEGKAGKTLRYRSDEDVERLQELRRKQQPGADWTVADWEKVFLGLESNKDDAFVAKRVVLTNNVGEWREGEVTEYEYHPWTSFRVKAVLRSGKMLPYSILARLTAKSQWTSTERLIAAHGELPDLSQTVLDAVAEVSNEGYREALARVRRNEVSLNGSAANQQENRSLELVSQILNAWEARDRKSAAGGRCRQDRDLWDQGQNI